MIERELFINVKETPQAFLSTSTFSSFLFTSASFLFSSEIACGGEEKAREGEELERKRESKVSKASSVHHSLIISASFIVFTFILSFMPFVIT